MAYLLSFLIFGGYYSILILVINLGSPELSRFFTIPLRLIVLLIIIYFVSKLKTQNVNVYLFPFVVFSVAYFLRIFISEVNFSEVFYMSPFNFFIFYLSFVFLPLLFLSRIKFSEYHYKSLCNGLIFGGGLLAILVLIFYREFIGANTRISNLLEDDNYISPLALSYVSSLTIGVIGTKLIYGKLQLKQKILYLIITTLSIIPFFLGASRGSLFAMLLPYVLTFLFSKSFSKNINLLIGLVALVLLLFFATDFLGTTVFDRVFNIEKDISDTEGAGIRVMLWQDGINQFVNHPFLGDSLQTKKYNFHPHNIIIEAFMATGIIGGLPFFLFIMMLCIKSIKIIKYQPKYMWISVVFLQSLIQNMFSGAIWGISWLAISSAIVISFNYKKIQNEE